MPEEAVKQTARDRSKEVELMPPENRPAEVGRRVFEILDEVLRDKEDLGLIGKWHYHERLSQGKHWKSGSKKAALRTANLLHTHRIETRNLLTASNPTFDVERIGGEEIDEEKYQDLIHATEHWYHSQEQQDVLKKSINTGETAGVVVHKVRFDPTREFGIGEVVVDKLHPYYFGVYPVDVEDSQAAEANLHYEPFTVRELRRQYPDLADQIKPDTEWLNKIGDTRREIQSGGTKGQKWYASVSSVVKAMFTTNTAAGAGGITEKTLVAECWCRDYTMVPMKREEETLDDQGRGTGQFEEVETGEEEPKYPGFIRYIRVCNGGELVLEDRPNPSINPQLSPEQAMLTYLYDKFPFSRNVSEENDSHGWGMSDFEQLEGLQVEINKSLSQINLYKDKASRLKIINPQDSGVQNSEFTNYPGIINPASYLVSTGVRYMDPPKAPLDLYKALDIYKDLFFLVSGTFSLDQAQTEGRDVIAYKAIAALLERVSNRLRGKFQNYQKMIREDGRMYVSHVQNWYLEPRPITYRDESGEKTSKFITGPELIFRSNLTIVSGSMMPVSRVQEREEALNLYDKGAIDQEELLKKLGWDNYHAVLNRMALGPLANLLQRMAEIGAPEPLVEFMKELQTMDPKDWKRAVESGEIPGFQQLLEQASGEEPPQDPMQFLEQSMKEAEIAKEDAETRKVEAETELAIEKTRSEMVEQQVKSYGMELDTEKLKIERAESIHSMAAQRETERNARAKAVNDFIKQRSAEKRGQGPYRERGMKSNNQE